MRQVEDICRILMVDRRYRHEKTGFAIWPVDNPGPYPWNGECAAGTLRSGARMAIKYSGLLLSGNLFARDATSGGISLGVDDHSCDARTAALKDGAPDRT